MTRPALTRRLITVAAIAAVCTFSYVGVQGAASMMAKPTAVAVVDVETVFSALKEKTQIEADMQSRGESLKQEEANKKKSIAALQSDLQLLTPGTDAYNRKQAELEQSALSLQVWAQYNQKRIGRERVVQIEQLYRKTLDAIGRVAKDSGYDVVLFKEKAPDFTNANAQQISTMIQVRKLLWSSDQIDITQQIVQRMNNEYENAR